MNNLIYKINFKHSVVFLIFTIVFSSLVEFLNYNVSTLFCLFLILSIGISHGSLDNIKGKKLLEIYSFSNILVFYSLYLTTGLIIIGLWFLFPTFSLIIFLVIACYHFGKEDTNFLINYDLKFNFLHKPSFNRCSRWISSHFWHFEMGMTILHLMEWI